MENQIGPKGLGGWLILVGLGVVITPFRLLAIYVPLYLGIFKNGTWEALTTAGSESYHALWGPLLVGEILCNFGVIAVSIYMMYLYFAKHYLFPKFYIGLIIFSLVFIPLDAWLVSIILPNQPMFDPSKHGMRHWLLDSKEVDLPPPPEGGRRTRNASMSSRSFRQPSLPALSVRQPFLSLLPAWCCACPALPAMP